MRGRGDGDPRYILQPSAGCQLRRIFLQRLYGDPDPYGGRHSRPRDTGHLLQVGERVPML